MWVPKQVIGWFQISKDSVDTLRTELAVTKAELTIYKDQVAKLQIGSDWLRMKVNQLELEKAALLEKAYNIKLPVPELVRAPQMYNGGSSLPDQLLDPDIFNDMGDEQAKRIGLPTHNSGRN